MTQTMFPDTRYPTISLAIIRAVPAPWDPPMINDNLDRGLLFYLELTRLPTVEEEIVMAEISAEDRDLTGFFGIKARPNQTIRVEELYFRANHLVVGPVTVDGLEASRDALARLVREVENTARARREKIMAARLDARTRVKNLFG